MRSHELTRRRLLSLIGGGIAASAASPLLAAYAKAAASGGVSAPGVAPAAASVEAYATARPPQVVKFYSINPLSGPSGPVGIRAQAGMELAAKELNDAGGFQDGEGNRYTIQITKGDFGNDRNEAIALLRRAAADPGVLAVIGPTSSVGYVPMVPVAEQLKIVIIGLATVAPINPWNVWSYRINPVAAVGMPILVRAIARKTGMKKVAIIFDQTQDGHVAAAEATRRTATLLRIPVVADTAFRSNDQDFSAQISRIRAAEPDVIGIMAAPGDGAKVALQIRDAGLAQPLFTPDGQFTDTVYWDNAKGGIQGGYTFVGGVDVTDQSGAVRRFVDAYTKAYPDQSVNLFSAYGYDGLHTAVAAAKKANTGADRVKFQQAMASLQTTSPLGSKITFKNPPNGENQTPVVTVVQITGRGTFTKVN